MSTTDPRCAVSMSDDVAYTPDSPLRGDTLLGFVAETVEDFPGYQTVDRITAWTHHLLDDSETDGYGPVPADLRLLVIAAIEAAWEEAERRGTLDDVEPWIARPEATDIAAAALAACDLGGPQR